MLIEDAVMGHEAFADFTYVQDSRTACAVIETQRPDVVLLDLRMPGLSGWSVLEQLRERGLLGSLTVAVLSNSTSRADREASLEKGAAAYFVKPMDADGYTEIIATLAGSF